MNDGGWQRNWDLFFGALDLPADQRATYLEQACADAQSRHEVLALLAAHERGPNLLDRPPLLPDDEDGDAGAALIGAVIDRYRIVREIGSGGMGSVYEAEQQAPVRRTVALKLIKLGMDTREIVARFAQERQALAIMSHANIAQVFDGGATESGRPYFVMEYVDGAPITACCDAQRLSLARRVQLFLSVCDGVQHAHQRGIIHRDLKPSNVLVATQDGAAVPKIIDFGVAKAIHASPGETALRTQLGLAIGTPAYMSPEQLLSDGVEVDTRTDVYALAALLYELLVGVAPFERDRLQRGAASEPPPPSQRLARLDPARAAEVAACRLADPRELQRALRGELDWIVAKGLAAARADRYGSPGELAADLKRHLAHEPVQARAASGAYRARKFVRRHRIGVAMAAAAALLVTGVAVAMSVQALRLQRALAVAEREQARAEQVSAFLLGLFRGADPAQSGRAEQSAREILDAGARRVATELQRQPEVRARVQQTIGTAYREIGDYKRAREVLQQALAELPQPPDDAMAAALHNALGELSHDEGELDAAEKSYREALALRRRSAAGDGPIGDTLYNLATLHLDRGENRQGLDLGTEVLALHERAYGRASEQAASSLIVVGRAHFRLGDYAQADATLREAVARIRQLPSERAHQLAFALNAHSAVLRVTGRHDEALAMLAEALAIYRRVLAAGHSYTSVAQINLAQVQIAAGRYAEAESNAAEAAANLLRLLGEGSDKYANARLEHAIALFRQGRYAEAAASLQQVLSLDRRHRPSSADLADSAYWAGVAARALNRLDDAQALLEESIALRVAVHGDTHPAAAARVQLAWVLLVRGEPVAARAQLERALAVEEKRFGRDSARVAANLHAQGSVALAEGDFALARRLLREALATLDKALPAGHPDIAAVQHTLALAERRAGDTAAAEPLLRAALSARSERLPAAHPDLAETRAALAELLCASGRADDGRALLARAGQAPAAPAATATLREAASRCR